MKITEVSRNVTFLGSVNIGEAYNLPLVDGPAGHVLTTDGFGIVTWQSAVSGLTITTDDVTEASNLYYTQERVEDAVDNLIQDGTGLAWTYNDVSGTLVGNVSLGGFTSDDLPEGVTNQYYSEEKVDDRVASLIIDSASVTWTYNDVANTLKADAQAAIQIQDEGSTVATRGTINFIEGAGVSIDVVDNPGNSRADITINSNATPVTWQWNAGDQISTSMAYMKGPAGNFTNLTPFIVPFDCTLVALSASTEGSFTWNAEIHVGLSNIASLSVVSSDHVYASPLAIPLSAGDKISFYVNGMSILKPQISAWFRETL